MKTQHTPGPWNMAKMGNTRFYYDISDSNDNWIADVKASKVGDKACEANAKLIAAAPELYQALIKAASFVDVMPATVKNEINLVLSKLSTNEN